MHSILDAYCGSTFWDIDKIWYTEYPDLTECFELTVLVWIPCAFLWIFSGLEVLFMVQSKKKDIPWNWLNISKLFATTLLVVFVIGDFMANIRDEMGDGVRTARVYIYTPILKAFTFVLADLLCFYNRKYGMCRSGVQFVFWLLVACCGAFQFRTTILRLSNQSTDGLRPWTFSDTIFLAQYPVALLMLLLHCFADRKPRHSDYPPQKHPCPEENSSFLSYILFSWFDSLAWTGFRRPLVESDLWDMKYDDSAAEVVPRFTRHWKQTLHACGNIPRTEHKAAFKSDGAQVDFASSHSKKPASILPALIKTFGPMFLGGAILKLLQDLLTFVSPQILSLIIDFAKIKDYQWKGYLYAFALFITATVQTIFLSQYFNRMFIVGMQIRTALVSTIYRKALVMSNKARKESTVGEIVNLMSVDAQKFIDLTAYINMIWSAPMQIILAMYFLWQKLGPSVLAGLAVMIILIPINGFIANKVKSLQIRQMKNKDERVKLMNEILSGIKVLKLYAWEPSFENQVMRIRGKEIQVLKETAYMNAGTTFIWSCAPFLVTLLTFGVFVLSDSSNVLTPEVAFVSLALFSLMHLPMGLLPMVLVYAVEASVSIKRINRFMNSEELDPDCVAHDPTERDPIVIENATFYWASDDDAPTLRDINVRFKTNSLSAIVGAVGSGKSSLISACLGEMTRRGGRVNTNGRIAYVAQQAWIQNATLRDNILFGHDFDKKFYNRVIDACALKADLDMLPAGDQTEIGEKGINLSGGQKQRVSLARAVYAKCDLYLLDDPLSAVDSHVGKHIFDNVIGPSGMLASKTRILVTHGITYLPQTDLIVVLKDGSISDSGTYQELLNKGGTFADFLLQHIAEETDSVDEDELDMLQRQLSGVVGNDEFQRRITESRNVDGLTRHRSDTDSGSLRRSKSQEDGSSLCETNKRSDQLINGEKLIETEKAETGSVKWSVYKHYLKSIGLFLTMATIVLNLIFQAFSIGSNVWLGVWSDDQSIVSNGTTDTSKRDFYLGVYGALGIGQALSVFLSALALYIGTLSGAKMLHDLLLSNVVRTPCTTFFDVTPLGRILNRFSKDVDTLDNVLPMTIRGWISCGFSVIGTIVVISYTTPVFVTVVIPIGLLYYFIQRFYVATSRQLRRLESVSRSPIYSHFSETITGAHAIRAFGEQKRFIQESENGVDANQVCYYPSIISNRWLAVRLEMIGNLIILFGALFAVLSKDQNPGLVGLSVTYSLQITQTLNWLVRMTSDVETNIVAVERIKEYGEAPQEAAWEIPSKLPTSPWPSKGTVEFVNYSVRYRPGLDLVLKNVTFKIEGGEKVGIVGRTGAGKSSLTLALFRIIEAVEGQIIIDGINIATLGLHTLRSRLTIIPQDAVLFSGTLRMNLDPFDQHSDEEVWLALEHAHLKAFVKGLTAGLQHEVNEGGENLSVGQRQLICLSRALLRKTKVLILDEATAAVDLETDDLIQRTIRTEFKNCTVLTIAHRLNTIMDSDRVIVLDRGRIVEFDTPSKLLQQPQSIFTGMCKDAGIA